MEYERLYRSYERQIKAIASYQKPIRPASVEVLFNTVKWLRYIDPDDKSYLLKSTTLQMFETDEYVYEPGERSVGVFIVCSGNLIFNNLMSCIKYKLYFRCYKNKIPAII